MIDGLEKAGILWGRYRSVEAVVKEADSLLHLSGIMHPVEQPGVGTYFIPGPVFGFSEWEHGPPVRAPKLGEHTDQVLQDLLGIEPAELDDLRRRSVIGGAGGT